MQMGGSQGMDMGGWGRKYHIYKIDRIVTKNRLDFFPVY